MVFKGWSSFKENLGRRRDFNARAGSSDYSATDDELGVERSGNSTPAGGKWLYLVSLLPVQHLALCLECHSGILHIWSSKEFRS